MRARSINERAIRAASTIEFPKLGSASDIQPNADLLIVLPFEGAAQTIDSRLDQMGIHAEREKSAAEIAIRAKWKAEAISAIFQRPLPNLIRLGVNRKETALAYDPRRN